MDAQNKTLKIVYTVVERNPGKSFWVRVGIGTVNHDGSLNLRLDAVPVNGTLQVRDWEPRDAEVRREPEADAARARPLSAPRRAPDERGLA